MLVQNSPFYTQAKKKKLNCKETTNHTPLQFHKLQSKKTTHISQIRFRKLPEIEGERVGEDGEEAYLWLHFDFGARNQDARGN